MPLVHFHSHDRGHIVPYKQFLATAYGANGLVVQKATSNSIIFHDHRFSTDEKEVIDYLRKYPGFNRHYIELPTVQAGTSSKP